MKAAGVSIVRRSARYSLRLILFAKRAVEGLQSVCGRLHLRPRVRPQDLHHRGKFLILARLMRPPRFRARRSSRQRNAGAAPSESVLPVWRGAARRGGSSKGFGFSRSGGAGACSTGAGASGFRRTGDLRGRLGAGLPFSVSGFAEATPSTSGDSGSTLRRNRARQRLVLPLLQPRQRSAAIPSPPRRAPGRVYRGSGGSW